MRVWVDRRFDHSSWGVCIVLASDSTNRCDQPRRAVAVGKEHLRAGQRGPRQCPIPVSVGTGRTPHDIRACQAILEGAPTSSALRVADQRPTAIIDQTTAVPNVDIGTAMLVLLARMHVQTETRLPIQNAAKVMVVLD